MFHHIQQRVGRAVQAHTTKPALIYNDKSLSYRDLAMQAQQAANALAAHGIKAGDTVAIATAHPFQVAASILGALTLGAVYTIVDPDIAPLRLQRIVARHAPALMICEGDQQQRPAQIRQMQFETIHSYPNEWSGAGPNADEMTVVAIAYLSRSTGQLEGMQLTQANLSSFIDFNLHTANVGMQRVLCVHQQFTDLMAAVMLATFINGGSLTFLSPEDLQNQLQVVTREEDRPQTLVLPTSLLADLFTAQPASSLQGVRHVLTSGQAFFDAETLKQALKQQDIIWHNYFGFPAFQLLTVAATASFEDRTQCIHSGRTLPHTRVFILNQQKQFVSVGLIGNLYVAGSGVGVAYIANESLNSASFCDNPFEPGTRLYRTGYTARLRDNGRLEIIGQPEGELHLPDLSIALQEVDTLLQAYSGIALSCTVRRSTSNNPVAATAFVVAKDSLPPDQLQQYLEQQVAAPLPGLGFIQMTRLPCTPAGGIDRALLARSTWLDSRQQQEMESRLRQETGIDELAVLVRVGGDQSGALHIQDILPAGVGETWSHRDSSPQSPPVALHETGDRPLAVAVGAAIADEHTAPTTLTAALHNAAAQYPAHGVHYVHAHDKILYHSYQQLLEAAQCILGGLRAEGAGAGSHVLMQLANSEDFVPVFWACVLGGMIAVPLSVPANYDTAQAAVAKLHQAWQLLDKPLIVTDRAHLQPLRHSFTIAEASTPAIAVSDDLRQHPEDAAYHAASEHDPAVLLLTSGSTGHPKGVVLTHRNIILRSKATAQHNQFTSADISLNWMPLDHVGGIVMFQVRDVCLGCRQIHVNTNYILEDPVRWLDLIEQYRATITWAPNFAYALINDQHARINAKLRDLSSMRFILNAGESVNAHTVFTFLELLQAHQLPATAMHPAYGMSETSSAITYSDQLINGCNTGFHDLDQASLQGVIRSATEDSIVASFVEVGTPIPGISLRIVDAKNTVLPEDVVGRLQVKGVTVTPGYYRNPALNDEVFTSDGWFNTGDLAFIHAGRLTITGREKDAIIINGLNYHNHEIEAVVESVDGVAVSYTAACAVPSAQGDTEALAIFYCSDYPDFSQQMAQVAHIRAAVVQQIGVNPSYIIPVSKDEIPKTAIGKIQRSQLAKQFIGGAFAAITKQIDLFTANEQTVPDWFFTPTWLPEAHRFDPLRIADSYALLSDDTDVARQLIARLAHQNRRCVLVVPGSDFAKGDATTYTINYADKQHYAHLVAALAQEQIYDYIHLATCDLPSAIEQRSALAAAQDQGVFSLLFLTQALAEQQVPNASLTVVSRYSQAILEDDPVVYAAASVHGFLKTLPLEIDWLTCRHIDLDTASATRNSERIYEELGCTSQRAEIAYRGGQRLTPQLAQADLTQPHPVEAPMMHQGVYLVTGGLGGLGHIFARWLLQAYDARLIIVGSTELPPRDAWETALDEAGRLGKRLRAYKDLTDLSAHVLYQRVDIDDPAQIKAVIAQGEHQWNQPLAGVFHFAGNGALEDHWSVMDQRRIVTESVENFTSMFLPKVYGTWAIFQALTERPDLLVVSMSSVSSFFGSATFSAYSAANSFLDCLTLHQRHTAQRRVVCLNWTQWENIGMSLNNPPPMRDLAHARGYTTIGVQQGLYSLIAGISQSSYGQLLIGLNGANATIRSLIPPAVEDQQTLTVYYNNRFGSPQQELCAQLASTVGGQAKIVVRGVTELPQTSAGMIDYDALGQLLHEHEHEVDSGEPTNQIEHQLRAIWQDILGKKTIGIHDNFFALGGHSLLATQMVSRLRDTFDLEIRLFQLFAAPTIAELAATIAQLQLEQLAGADIDALFAEVGALPDEHIGSA